MSFKGLLFEDWGCMIRQQDEHTVSKRVLLQIFDDMQINCSIASASSHSTTFPILTLPARTP